MRIAPLFLAILVLSPITHAQDRVQPELFDVPNILSSWDDLTQGISTKDDWLKQRGVLKQRYLDLLRDQHKPKKPAMDLIVHEDVIVENLYRRQLISYAVESYERAHAYLELPLQLADKAPAIVALHGTYQYGKKQAAPQTAQSK